jgi:non-ribosomal peptide synthetase component E (peptide arylation enzyme)
MYRVGCAYNFYGYHALGRACLFDRIHREPFMDRGAAIPAGVDDPTALCFVACGQALKKHEIRIIDPDGHELPDRREGRLQFRGPSATSDYYRNPEATRRLFCGD